MQRHHTIFCFAFVCFASVTCSMYNLIDFSSNVTFLVLEPPGAGFHHVGCECVTDTLGFIWSIPVVLDVKAELSLVGRSRMGSMFWEQS